MKRMGCSSLKGIFQFSCGTCHSKSVLAVPSPTGVDDGASFGLAAGADWIGAYPRSRTSTTNQFSLRDMNGLHSTAGWWEQTVGVRGGLGNPTPLSPVLGGEGCLLAFAFLVLADFGFADDGQQLLDNVLAFLAFGLGLKIRADAMAQHGNSHFLHVLNGHTESAIHRRHRLAAVAQELAGARSRAVIDHLLDEVRRGWVLWPGRPHQPRDVVENIVA